MTTLARMPMMSEDDRATVVAAIAVIAEANHRLTRVIESCPRDQIPAIRETFMICGLLAEAVTWMQLVTTVDPEVTRMVLAIAAATRELTRSLDLRGF